MSHLQNRGGALPVGYLARRLDGAREPLSRRRLTLRWILAGGQKAIPPGAACRPPRVTRETHGSACRRAPGPPTERVPCFATCGTPHRPPRGGSSGGRVTRVSVGFRLTRASPLVYRFQHPPGTSPTYTELSTTRPGWPHAAIWHGSAPRGFRPWSVPVSVSPGSALQALRAGVR